MNSMLQQFQRMQEYHDADRFRREVESVLAEAGVGTETTLEELKSIQMKPISIGKFLSILDTRRPRAEPSQGNRSERRKTAKQSRRKAS